MTSKFQFQFFEVKSVMELSESFSSFNYDLLWRLKLVISFNETTETIYTSSILQLNFRKNVTVDGGESHLTF